jgi:hypothetical protein
MALFRKRLGVQEAQQRLLTIVMATVSDDERLSKGYGDIVGGRNRLRSEFCALRLFAVLVATKETRYQDWQVRGRELFDQLFESTLRSVMSENGEPEFLAREWLGESVKYYALSQHLASSLDALGTEVGKGFSMVLSESPSDALARLGRGVFFLALDRTLAMHADTKLA